MISRKKNDIKGADFALGEVILIDKDSGWTSFDVVKKVRNLVKVKKVGHAGTLDPFATGLLVLCTGRKTKEISLYQEKFKAYSGTIELGKRTSTMDPEGEVLEEKPYEDISEKDILDAARSFIGVSEQMPPMYSAKKHKGKALYKYARKGVEIERQPVSIEIKSFDITEINLPDVKFSVTCSKGTYVRVLAEDFGKKLNTAAFLKELRRTAIGEFNVEDALKIDEFVQLIEDERKSSEKKV